MHAFGLAIAASALGGAAWAPHALRVRRHRGDGLSPTAMALSVITALWWTWFAVLCSAPAAVVASACGTITAAAYLAASGRTYVRSAGAVVVAGAVALPALAVIAPAAIAVVATGGSATQVIPQAVKARKEGAGAAVSGTGWALSGMSSVLWLAYAIAIHRPMLGAPAIVTVPAAAVIVHAVAQRADGR